VVHEALRSGGAGYVLKKRAGTELLPAIKSVLAGRHFVSGGLEVPETTTARHEVMFYSDERDFLEILADFIRTNMNSGKTAIVVATKSYRDDLIERLKTEPLDIDGAILERTYIALDSADTLRAMMVHGVPDRARLFESVGGIIDLASKAKKPGQHGVAVCGQCAPLLLAKGEAETAIQVEKLWDELTKTRGIDLMCAYPMSSFRGGQEDPVFQRVCAEHSAVHFRWTSFSAY